MLLSVVLHNCIFFIIPVCGGVGGGVEVGRTTDVELASGEPVEDLTEHKQLCLLLATRHTHLSLQLSEVETAEFLLQVVQQC